MAVKFKIVAVGKVKEKYFTDAIGEYVKRLSRYAKVEIVETDECLCKGVPNASEIDKVIRTEGKNIIKECEGYVVVLDVGGKLISSEELSTLITANKQTASTFTFVIGGSYGLSDEVKQLASSRISFGRITLPHQLCRVVLCEQLYRACTLEANVPYHK